MVVPFCMLLLVFDDDDAAVWLAAFAVGADAVDFFDGDVNDAAFSGIHWIQGNTAMGALALFCHALGEGAELFCLAFAVVFDVEYNTAVLGELAVDNKAHEELDGVQGFAVAADEDADVFASDIKADA